MVNSNAPHPFKKADGTGSFTDKVSSRQSGVSDSAIYVGNSDKASAKNDTHSDGGDKLVSSSFINIELNKDKSQGNGLLES